MEKKQECFADRGDKGLGVEATFVVLYTKCSR